MVRRIDDSMSEIGSGDWLALAGWIRPGIFIGVLALLALLETVLPRRHRLMPPLLRWFNNLSLIGIDTLMLRVVYPVPAIALALTLESRGIGILNSVSLPAGASIVLAVLALDLAIYLQHRVFHWLPWLWRMHRVHHADPDFDVSTGVRFHPAEMLLSMAFKILVIALLGAPAVAVLLFEVLLNASSLFTHANLRLPPGVDRRLRWLLVTPDMHRVHHSVYRPETDSNFGFTLSLWDRLFGTYQFQPRDGHTGMQIGQANFRSSREQWLDRLLLQPLRPGRR